MHYEKSELTIIYNSKKIIDKKTLAIAQAISSNINRQDINEVRLSNTLFRLAVGKLNLKAKLINEMYYNFNIENNGNKINIFFDKNSYDLIGWQTEDIYQNLVITYIYNIKKNKNIDEKLFNLPKQH